ncbi:PIR protein, putative [Plasmodium sp. gorilla clade G1]|nr:PIR protein, putative [Plasmodium sp. gorilla clade G1]
MKVHYNNILLFALPINVFVKLYHAHNQRNHKNTVTYKPINKPTKTPRSLCECDLHRSIYDNDPEMQKVMENYNRQISQRFEEHNRCIKDKRQKCKKQCDTDIQKIILKDKIEKELTENFSALQTDITTEDISTSVCKKNLADKMEKTCLKYTQNFGGVVAPCSGVLGGIAELALNVWKDAEIVAAIAAAKEAGAAAGIKAGEAAGLNKFIQLIQSTFHIYKLDGQLLKSFLTTTHYTNVSNIANAINTQIDNTCSSLLSSGTNSDPMCGVRYTLGVIADAGKPMVDQKTAITGKVTEFVTKAEIVAKGTTAEVTSKTTAMLTTKKTGLIDTTYMGYQTTIIASIIAILIIILIMVIIYLILRYRRKKKMKKKLQYIKLLKE